MPPSTVTPELQSRRRDARRITGFSLVEMVMALAVFSALVLMGLPRLADFQHSLATKAVARNVSTNFRLAQQRAATANRRCHVDFDMSQDFFSVWLDKDGDNAYDGVSEVRAVGFAYSDELGSMPGVKLPPHTSLESTTLPDGVRGLPSVVFTADGGVVSPGEVVLRDDSGRRYKVEVSLAGGVTILQDRGGTWVE
jgi:prepilin-type N-terminal cleavage/methylation domain-containing protein